MGGSAGTPSVGVDGCRGGWIAAEIGSAATDRTVRWTRFDAIEPLLHAWPEAVIGIDMPLGLPRADAGRRISEQQARTFLGPDRSSIFFTPPRAVVERWSPEASHAEVSAWAKQTLGAGISIQTWNILGKVREADTALRGLSPTTRSRVVEVHPECSFRQLAIEDGSGLNPGLKFVSKGTAEGVAQRLGLLREWFDVDLAGVPKGVRPDDALDAVAAAWSARRWADGQALVFPSDVAEWDDYGLPMRIVR
jgi:predicted RNase H-like nuclease